MGAMRMNQPGGASMGEAKGKGLVGSSALLEPGIDQADSKDGAVEVIINKLRACCSNM